MVSTRLFQGLCAVVFFAAGQAHAQSGNAAAAETLFQEGRALFQEGRYAEACPKLAESQRLDPATGTLLALALCHEGEGKLATAWAEFVDVEGRATREGRTDRVQIAREHAQALKPRLSTLAVDVPPEVAQTPGLELSVNGTALGPGSFGVAVPVDGGEHRVEATAPGKEPWSMTISVKPESDAARVAVPPLADAAAAPAPAGPEAPAQAAPAGDSGATLRTAGLITAGAGVVALGIGTYLALDAKSDYDAAKERCDGTRCPSGPFRESEDARGQGTAATVVFVIGGAALAAGAALWFLAPSHEQAATGPRVDRVGVGPGSLVVGGTF